MSLLVLSAPELAPHPPDLDSQWHPIRQRGIINLVALQKSPEALGSHLAHTVPSAEARFTNLVSPTLTPHIATAADTAPTVLVQDTIETPSHSLPVQLGYGPFWVVP